MLLEQLFSFWSKLSDKKASSHQGILRKKRLFFFPDDFYVTSCHTEESVNAFRFFSFLSFDNAELARVPPGGARAPLPGTHSRATFFSRSLTFPPFVHLLLICYSLSRHVLLTPSTKRQRRRAAQLILISVHPSSTSSVPSITSITFSRSVVHPVPTHSSLKKLPQTKRKNQTV